MQVPMRPGADPFHLTYCLNIHPGETWEENLDAVRVHVPAVREALGVPGPFGLGLRLARRGCRGAAGGQEAPGRLDTGAP